MDLYKLHAASENFFKFNNFNNDEKDFLNSWISDSITLLDENKSEENIDKFIKLWKTQFPEYNNIQELSQYMRFLDSYFIGLNQRIYNLSMIYEFNVAYSKDYIIKDRKSTRLNSSHVKISYDVFCLKKIMQ